MRGMGSLSMETLIYCINQFIASEARQTSLKEIKTLPVASSFDALMQIHCRLKAKWLLRA